MFTLVNGLKKKREDFDRRIAPFPKKDPLYQRLGRVLGVGVLTATGFFGPWSANPFRLKNGRHFAAYAGLVSRQHSIGGKRRYSRESRKGETPISVRS